MKRILLCLVVISAGAQAQTTSGTDVIIGKTDSLYSHILKEHRRLLVHVPKGYQDASVQERYPVLFLLNNHNIFFRSAVGAIEYLGGGYNLALPSMIIVNVYAPIGIRDFTPTASDYDLFDYYPGRNRGSGGADPFLDFMEKELIPYIDSAYPTLPHRTVFGRTLSGLFAIYALNQRTNLFNACIAVAPSMWWDRALFLRQMDSSMHLKSFNHRALFLGIANISGGDTVAMKKDTSRVGSHNRSLFDLTKTLRKAQDLRWNYRFYQDDDHYTVSLIALHDALRFVFRPYYIPDFMRYLMDIEKYQVSFLSNHYQNASKVLGYNVQPPEWMLHEVVHTALSEKKLAIAGRVAEWSMQFYPGSAKTSEQMGDYYMAMNNKRKAAEWYQKSLDLKDSPELRRKLVAAGE